MRVPFRVFASLALIAALQGCVRHVAVPVPADRLGPAPGPGMIEVEFVAGQPDRVWEVYAGGEMICTTPCLRMLPAGQPFLLESQYEETVFVPDLSAEAKRSRRTMLIADGVNRGKHVNGIVFTTFGGMGVVTGITLAAVGCSDLERRPGTCTAGLITGGVSIPVTAFALWLLLDGLPKAHALPVEILPAQTGQPPVSLSLTPNGIAGTF